MDSFEARVHFSKQLASLTPSRQASHELVKFLIRSSEIQDDLYPVILETLHRVDLSARINILQFLQDLVATIVTDNQNFAPGSPVYNYVKLTVQDLPAILAEVLPRKPRNLSGQEEDRIRPLTNLIDTYEIFTEFSRLLKFPKLKEYQDKFDTDLLTDDDKLSIKSKLPFNEGTVYQEYKVPDMPNAVPLLHQEEMYVPSLVASWDFLIGKKRQSQYERILIDESEKSDQTARSSSPPPSTHGNPLLMTQKQMLQRIEADRERQKRGKETVWRVRRPNNEVRMSEFEHIYNSLDKFDARADRALLDELSSLFKTCVPPPLPPQPKGQPKGPQPKGPQPKGPHKPHGNPPRQPNGRPNNARPNIGRSNNGHNDNRRHMTASTYTPKKRSNGGYHDEGNDSKRRRP